MDELKVGDIICDKKRGDLKVVEVAPRLVKVQPIDNRYEHRLSWMQRSDIKFIGKQWQVKRERREKVSRTSIAPW